jgi:hypothetical protein
MWLLYLLMQDGVNECSSGVLAATFNKHFKSFGAIKQQNILRDLAKEKGKSGWVNSDATKEPQTWLLLEAGKKGIAALIQQSKGAE